MSHKEPIDLNETKSNKSWRVVAGGYRKVNFNTKMWNLDVYVDKLRNFFVSKLPANVIGHHSSDFTSLKDN